MNQHALFDTQAPLDQTAQGQYWFVSTLFAQEFLSQYLSRLMTKPTKWHVSPVKTQISLVICPVWSESRPVKFLEKKLVTTRAMTNFSEQDARVARTRRITESGNTSLLLTSLVKWSAKLIGSLCSARIIIYVSAIVIPWPVFECDSTLKKPWSRNISGPKWFGGEMSLYHVCFHSFMSSKIH